MKWKNRLIGIRNRLTMYTYCSKIEEKEKEGIFMATTTPTQIRIEESTKKQAVELLEGLGLNLSDAINMFLRQVILQNGIPFEVKYPEFKPEVLEAMEEAKRVSRDPSIKGYTDIEELFEELNS
ncbi:MAG: type II toxin-antitoxin system RelB/DinJ family antitoxin [Bacteroides fragilis]|nr:type II toxin-antitoxin system RelB/DinJ family antitoxin [Bacteroides fragilis]